MTPATGDFATDLREACASALIFRRVWAVIQPQMHWEDTARALDKRLTEALNALELLLDDTDNPDNRDQAKRLLQGTRL